MHGKIKTIRFEFRFKNPRLAIAALILSLIACESKVTGTEPTTEGVFSDVRVETLINEFDSTRNGTSPPRRERRVIGDVNDNEFELMSSFWQGNKEAGNVLFTKTQ